MIVDIEIIEKYNDWKARKGVESKDYSPKQFQIEYAKELALERLTRVAAYIEDELANSPTQGERDILEDIKALVEGENV